MISLVEFLLHALDLVVELIFFVDNFVGHIFHVNFIFLVLLNLVLNCLKFLSQLPKFLLMGDVGDGGQFVLGAGVLFEIFNNFYFFLN